MHTPQPLPGGHAPPATAITLEPPRSRILVTGAAGYLGGALVRALLQAGHAVVAVDTMVFGERALAGLAHHQALTIRRMDVRGLQREHLSGVQAVVDLAGIADAEAAELDPAWTDAVNHRARVRLAQLAQRAGVPRYVLASSTGVYAPGSAEVDESTPAAAPATLGAYERANLKAEAAVLPLALPAFAPTVLRLAPVHGLAPRTRFDSTLNAMALQALTAQRIQLPAAGELSRPLLHVDDAVAAILATLAAPREQVSRQVLLVSAGQLTLLGMAYAVRTVLGSHIAIDPAAPAAGPAAGPRAVLLCSGSPPLNTAKALRLIGWAPQRELLTSIGELLDALDAHRVEPHPASHAARWYAHIFAQAGVASAAQDPATACPPVLAVQPAPSAMRQPRPAHNVHPST